MKRLLIGGRLDGKVAAIKLLSELVEKNNPDAVAIGGMWAGSHRHDRKMSPTQNELYRELFQTLKRFKRPVFVLPGEHDVPLADFMRIVMMAEVDDGRLHCVHATPWVESCVQVIGVGGDLNEVIDTWNDRLRCSRSAAEYYLRHTTRRPVPHTVLMLTTPVAGPLGTVVYSDIAGDEKLASELVHSVHPELAIAFGETSCRGMRRVAGTRILNPGRLSDGSAAMFDLSDPDHVLFTPINGFHSSVA
jgi:Icc-related predicted phosphoesterase